MVAAGDGPTSLSYAIARGSCRQHLFLAGSSVVGLVITGPVSVNDTGTVVTCQVLSSSGAAYYSATLTILGE